MSGTRIMLPVVVVLAGACALPQPHEPDWDRAASLDRSGFTEAMKEGWVFGYWDANGDASVDPAEFHATLNGRGARFTPAHGFRAWDSNGDGGLDREELYAGAFRELDLNGNGTIEGIELRIIGRGMGLPGLKPAATVVAKDERGG